MVSMMRFLVLLVALAGGGASPRRRRSRRTWPWSSQRASLSRCCGSLHRSRWIQELELFCRPSGASKRHGLHGSAARAALRLHPPLRMLPWSMLLIPATPPTISLSSQFSSLGRSSRTLVAASLVLTPMVGDIVCRSRAPARRSASSPRCWCLAIFRRGSLTSRALDCLSHWNIGPSISWEGAPFGWWRRGWPLVKQGPLGNRRRGALPGLHGRRSLPHRECRLRILDSALESYVR